MHNTVSTGRVTWHTPPRFGPQSILFGNQCDEYHQMMMHTRFESSDLRMIIVSSEQVCGVSPHDQVG